MDGKWENIAKRNFYDNAFTDWMQVAKAYNSYQQKSIPLTEGSYRAQAAILNALLTHHLDFTTNKFLDTKAEIYLKQFDTLVARSSTLEKTGTLEELQRLVKCLLYARVGDYLMGWLKFQKKDGEDRTKHTGTLILALCAYALALEHVLKCPYINGKRQLDQNRSLLAIELYLLISKNIGEIVQMEELVMAMSNQKLSYLLLKRLSSSSPTKQSTEASFISSDISHRVANGWQFNSLEIEKYLPVAWQMNNTSHFFRRLIWILNQEEIAEFEHYPFLNNQLNNRLAICPKDLDEPCSPYNLTLMDMKIYLFRASRAVSLSSETTERDITFPWIFCPRPSVQQAHAWDSIIAVCTSSKLELSQTISLTNALEQIRLQTTVPWDKVNLAQTMTYLEKVSNDFLKTENSQAYVVYMELAERYANTVLLAVEQGGASGQSPGSMHTKTLFPPPSKVTSVVMDDEVSDQANIFLAKRLYEAQRYEEAKWRLMDVSQRNCYEESVTKIEKKYTLPNTSQSVQIQVTHQVTPQANRADAINLKPANMISSATMTTNMRDSDRELDRIQRALAKCVVHNKLLIKLFEVVPDSWEEEGTRKVDHEFKNYPAGHEPNQELNQVRRVLAKCVSHNKSLIKSFEAHSIPLKPLDLGSLNITTPPKLDNVQQLTRDLKVKFLQDRSQKQQICSAKFSTVNGAYKMEISKTDGRRIVYDFGADSLIHIISLLTVRLINLKVSGALQKPIFLTCMDPNDYNEILNVLNRSSYQQQNRY
ncbi:hypothetical protein DdX_01533 [Ditylenchus destructor]|uniref:Uncharacterized protein n=1 Tax=Ditylenchus destructor TaxID=166010 RepID=A0AAD4NJE2_9BILA|nr:hypothetical protein DdX_01533 [Ditylenchus destructor]